MRMDLASRLTASSEANRLLKQLDLRTLPINVFNIGRAIDVRIVKKPNATSGVSGALVKIQNEFVIAYATHIKSKGFQRFSIAHELGHLHIPGHADALLPIGKDVHESHAGYQSGDRYEREADEFAATLLMPERVFVPAMRSAGEGLSAILELAELCETSLIATAIRFVKLTRDPVAVVVSEKSRLCYAFLSNAMMDFDEIEWPKKDSALGCVPTAVFNRDSPNVTDGARNEFETPMVDWFGGEHSALLREEVMGLGRYGRTLTVLTSDSLAEDDESERDLVQSWKPKFKR